MKIIFLDVDGVLNCQSTRANCRGMMGIDNDKVKRLKKIVEISGAEIVLISSWKEEWQKVYKAGQGRLASYLDRKLWQKGLIILDKTKDDSDFRGRGILNWLDGKKIESFIILDDEDFDYKEAGLEGRVVKTKFFDDYGGLQDKEMNLAIEILGCREK